MLTWVGKRPLTHVTAFPAQLIERFSAEPAGSPLRTWPDWPASYQPGGLLFHGDNKEVLAHLLANGFRGKVDLVYIDPPFDSGADYVRKVSLRGPSGTAKLSGEHYTLGEQIQYTDIWANDNYLQFMYERLQLLRELLSTKGVLIVHCDWRKVHHLRLILDEVLGAGQFRSEVHWYFYNKMHDDRKDVLPRATNSLLVYSKGADATFHRVAVPRERMVQQLRRVKVDGVLVNLKDEAGNLVYQDSDSKTLDNVWPIPLIPPADVRQKTDYPTQKPEALLDLAIRTYSDPEDVVLDCFVGSGTTCASAQRLGRRWIGCDINSGAIQTTAKRLQGVIREQVDERVASASAPQPGLPEMEESDVSKSPQPAQLNFSVWRVNDYDLHIQHNEAVNLACEHIGVERTRVDGFFDGTLKKQLVKIIPFDHPLSPVDLEEVKREIDARPDDERGIALVCLGIEHASRAWLEDWNRLRKGKTAINRIDVIELRSDATYGSFLRHEPARAKVAIRRVKGHIAVTIEEFISPSIVERLRQQAGLLQPRVDDWRAMVDCVMIDTAWNGSVFTVTLSDIPERKTDFVSGTYDVDAPAEETTVAVKIIDMLGEEVLVTARV
ncbi:MAG: site-specific DNA-methyltransferase [Vicinamibacterales bacterium]